jgi:hypothetical protein
MPEKFQPREVYNKKTKQKIIVDSEVLMEELANDWNNQGYKPEDFESKPYIPVRPTDWLDRGAGASMGVAMGIPAGLPGMAVGGAMGAMFPPKTLGDAGAMAAGAITGGPMGKLIQKGTQMFPKAGSLMRGLGGLIGAETGAVTKSVLDDGKAEGFNPLSMEGAAAALIPNAANSISQQLQASPGVLQQKLRSLGEGFGIKLPNSKLSSEASMVPQGKITNASATAAKPALAAVKSASQATLKPYEDNVQDLIKTRTELAEQLNLYKTNPPKGMFQATQQGAAQKKIADELDKIDEQLDYLSIAKATATAKAMRAKIDLENSTQTQSGPKGRLNTQKANLAVGKEKLGGVKERWEEKYLQEQEIILKDNTLDNRQRRDQLSILRNKYQQTVNQFDQQISDLKIDSKYIDADLKKVGRGINPSKIALQAEKNLKGDITVDEAGLKVQKGKLQTEADNLSKQEEDYYKEASRVTGVAIKDVNSTIKNFQTALKDKSILPKDIKSLVDNSDDMDKFVQTIKTYRPDQIKEVISFLPPAQQAKFKSSMGEAVVFDFFTKSFNPQTGLMDKMPQYIQKYGVPNLEVYYDAPEAQKSFIQLAEAFQKAIPKDGAFIKNYLKAATLRGIAYNGLTVLFGASAYHSNKLAMGVAAGVVATVGVAAPQMVSAAMKNPKLAKDFIKFVESGGTLTYAQLPYLATFIKNEGKPITENELTDQQKYIENLNLANELNTPENPSPQINQQGPTSPAPAMPQQQPRQPNQQP